MTSVQELTRKTRTAVFVTMQNHWQYSSLACRSLEAYTPDNVELHLVDDCSTDQKSIEWLNDLTNNPRWHVWRHERATGLTYGWNEALQYCMMRGLDYVGLLNNDICVGPNWYRALLHPFMLDQKTGIAGPLTNHPGYQTLQDIIASNGVSPVSKEFTPHEVADHSIVNHLCHRLEECSQASGAYAHELPYTNGFMFLLSAKVVKEVGLFDPKNRNLGNEDEYQRRMKKLGWKSYCSLETFVWHAKDVSVEKGWKSTPRRMVPRLPPRTPTWPDPRRRPAKINNTESETSQRPLAKITPQSQPDPCEMAVFTFATPGGSEGLFQSFLQPSANRVGWHCQNMARGGIEVEFAQDGWYELMQQKSQAMHDAVVKNHGKCILWLDSDVLIVKAFDLENLIGDADIAAQKNRRNLCTGAMIIRCNQRVQDVFYDTANAKEFYCPSPIGTADQRAFNHIYKGRLNARRIDTNLFWTPGARDLENGWQHLGNGNKLRPDQIPSEALIIHANFCVGFSLKRDVLVKAAKRFSLRLPPVVSN